MRFLSTILLLFILACQSVGGKPTFLQVSELQTTNNHTQALATSCFEKGVYKPTKPDCKTDELRKSVDETRAAALRFINQDPKQAHGFSVFLVTSRIYFVVAKRTLDDYSQAQRIARDFFTTQKASYEDSNAAYSPDFGEAVFHLTQYTATYLAKTLAEGKDLSALDMKEAVEVEQIAIEYKELCPPLYKQDFKQATMILQFLIKKNRGA